MRDEVSDACLGLMGFLILIGVCLFWISIPLMFINLKFGQVLLAISLVCWFGGFIILLAFPLIGSCVERIYHLIKR